MTFEDVDVPTMDTVPEGLSEIEYPCVECGKEAGPYGGRGRRPTRCDEHKVRKSPSSTTQPKVSGAAASLAAQATEALWQIPGFIAIGCMFVTMTDTAAAILSKEEAFRNQVYAALLTDKAMCESILRGGVKGAKIGLLLAALGLVASVAPVAWAEYKEIAEERREKKAAELGAADA